MFLSSAPSSTFLRASTLYPLQLLLPGHCNQALPLPTEHRSLMTSGFLLNPFKEIVQI